MSKRNATILLLLAVFAVGIIGMETVGFDAINIGADNAEAATLNFETGIILASDEVCPPSVQPPCG